MAGGARDPDDRGTPEDRRVPDWAWDYFSASRASQPLDRSDAPRIDWRGEADDPTQEAHRGRALRRHHHRHRRRRRDPGPHAGAVGKRILLLERGDYLPREMENWDGPWSSTNRYISARDLVRRRRQAVPAAGALLRRRRHQALRRGAVPAAARGLRRAAPRRRRVAGLAADYDDFEPGTPRRSGSTRSTATAARTRPRATGRSRTRGRRCRTSPGSSSSSTTSQRRATTRSTRRAAILLDEADRPKSTCIRCTWCDGYPCLVHAKSDAEVIAVRPDPRPAQRHAAGRRRGDAAGDRRARAHGHRRGRRRATAARRSTGRHRRRSRPGRRTPPSCCSPRRTTGTRTGWPTARTRSAATTCSTTARPWSRCPRSPTTPCSRRRSASTTSTSAAPDYDCPDRQHPDGRQVEREAMKGEEPS